MQSSKVAEASAQRSPLIQQRQPVGPPPPYTPPQESMAPRYNDVMYIPLFLLCMVAVYVVIAFNFGHLQAVINGSAVPPEDHHSSAISETDISNDNNHHNNNTNSNPKVNPSTFVMPLVLSLGAALFASAVSVLLWLVALMRSAETVIWTAVALKMVVLILYAAIFAMYGQLFGSLIFVLFILILALFIWACRFRIKLAALVLSNVAGILSQHKAMIVLAFGALLFSTLYMGVWVLAFLTAASNPDQNLSYGLLVFVLFSFYWFSQVVTNTVHVTCAGTYATAILCPQPFATTASFRRAVTYSFGSICFGSLIIALIQTLKAVLNGMKRSRKGFLVACAVCILSCIEDIIRYFNTYAFTQVAIYGKTFCEAARDTWQLFLTNGFDLIINDDWTGFALNMIVLLTGLLSAGVAVLVMYVTTLNNGHFNHEVAVALWVIAGFLGFFIGLVVSSVVFEIVNSGVKATLVCFALSTEAFRNSMPELYGAMAAAYGPQLGFAQVTYGPPGSAAAVARY